MWLLIHAGIRVKPCWWKGTLGSICQDARRCLPIRNFSVIATTLGSMSTWYRSDTFTSDRYLIHILQRVFAIWAVTTVRPVQVSQCIWDCDRHIIDIVNIQHNNKTQQSLYFHNIWFDEWRYLYTGLICFHQNLLFLLFISISIHMIVIPWKCLQGHAVVHYVLSVMLFPYDICWLVLNENFISVIAYDPRWQISQMPMNTWHIIWYVNMINNSLHFHRTNNRNCWYWNASLTIGGQWGDSWWFPRTEEQ